MPAVVPEVMLLPTIVRGEPQKQGAEQRWEGCPTGSIEQTHGAQALVPAVQVDLSLSFCAHVCAHTHACTHVYRDDTTTLAVIHTLPSSLALQCWDCKC